MSDAAYTSLRGNVSFLGRLLGDTIAAAEGQPFLDLVADKSEWIDADVIAQLITGPKTVIDLNLTIQDKIGNQRLFNTSVAANTDTDRKSTRLNSSHT